MSSLYNEYLTGAEREAAIIIAESDAHLAKLNVLLEAVDATLEANILSAEAKVFAENGTYDDLVMLYTEAEKEASDKKQGIFAAIFGAIKNFFKKIGDALTNAFGKNKDDIPEKANVPEDFEGNMNILERIWNQIKSAFALFKSGDIKGGCLKIVGLFSIDKLGLPAAIGAATTVVVVNRDKLQSWIDSLKNKQEEVVAATAAAENAINSGTTKLDLGATMVDAVVGDAEKGSVGQKVKDGVNKAVEFTKETAKKALDIIKKIGSWIMNAIAKLNQWVRNKFTGNSTSEDQNLTNDTSEKKDADESKFVPITKTKNDQTKNNSNDDQKPTENNAEKKDNESTELDKGKLLNDVLPPKEQAKLEKKRKKELKVQKLNDVQWSAMIVDALREKEKTTTDPKIKEKIKKILTNKDNLFDTSKKNTVDESQFDFESVSLFGIELNTEDFLYESEMTDEDYNELCELFAEL